MEVSDENARRDLRAKAVFRVGTGEPRTAGTFPAHALLENSALAGAVDATSFVRKGLR